MKDKLLEESLKLDKIIEDHCGIEKNPAIIFLYANIDKIKFLASSEYMYNRQDLCVHYISHIYYLSDSVEEEIRSILKKNGIINHNTFMYICGFIFICAYIAYLIYLNYGFSVSHILLYIVIIIIPFILYMTLIEYLSGNYYLRLYFIPKEYRGMKLEKHSLKRGFK